MSNQANGHQPSQEAPILTDPGITDPVAVLRLAATASRVRADLDQIELDGPGAERLATLYGALTSELREAVSPDMADEVAKLLPPLDPEHRSPAEVHLAHSQLTGWIEGLLAGTQVRSPSDGSPDRASGGADVDDRPAAVDERRGYA